MSEENSESGGEGPTSGVDPTAIAMALEAARTSPALKSKVEEFLDEQISLIRAQKHHLHEQLKQVHLGIWEKWLGVALRVATAIMGLAIAGGLGFMVWSAAHSDGLVVEPFSVPPDLAQQGLTGQVVAAKLLDRLATMQAQTNSQRPAKSYANNWSESGIKLEIPETGVSLIELDSFLRQKLGHDSHATGEIVRTASGLSLTARVAEAGAESVTGPQTEIDGLVQALAEKIFHATQPYRYAYYLDSHGRFDEAGAIFAQLVKTGSGDDRLYSFNKWAQFVAGHQGIDAALRVLQQGLAEDPRNMGALSIFGLYQSTKSHPEETLRAGQESLEYLSNGTQRYLAPALVPTALKIRRADIDLRLGAFQEAAQTWSVFARTGAPGYAGTAVFSSSLAMAEIGAHDWAAARMAIAELPDEEGFTRNAGNSGGPVFLGMRLDAEAGDWAGVLSRTDAIAAMVQKHPSVRSYYPSLYVPLLAYAEARSGRIAQAQARIAPTPADCYDCLVTRALIAQLLGQPARADWWFARAVQAAPSIPFAYFEWGRALLARGQPEQAIAQFKLSNAKGPHFADALEGWGEALMAKNQSHLALAKFEEAEKYAPNWGRLHLKWGEALYYAGKRDEARAQFARAAALDLTPSEKSELSAITLGAPHV